MGSVIMNILSKCCAAIALHLLVLPLAAQEDGATDSVDLQEQLALAPHALAVLPIEILTNDPRAPTLAAEAYEAVMNELALIEGLYVLEQQLVAPYADSSLPPEEIGRRLGVGHILEWSVEADRFAVMLKVDLRNAQTGGTSGLGHPLEISPDIKIDDPPFDLDALIPGAGRQIAEMVRTALFPTLQPDPEQVLAETTARFLDTSLPDNERMRALRSLSPLGGGDRRALSGSVAVAAAELAINSDDAGVRSGVWWVMAGVDDPYLVQPLLHSLANDGDENVRWQAAKALTGFLDEPGVRDALSYARNYDASEIVRGEIRFSMLSDTEQEEDLRATALNTALTDRERSLALGRFWLRNHEEPLDTELTVAMVELARAAASPRIRLQVWSSLSGSDDSYLVQPLLDTLANDPDEHVREIAASLLTKFSDYSGVGVALEEAQLYDNSPLVRTRAERSLNYFNR